ncbi:MAG: MTH938/NDUFAF3 family protein [candidate division WOR-3 bacterium]|nr:MTH938/NDUFAF3 family protein [candidate division WOR-3 bacterium]MCX7757494.1 MTH938/NDUFAF3 family protein [candidate division WOR-3 bacterium]MDW7987127.1 MTH938/NDUFAF3 family protein [candidate division WOR-3 bacterium]
MRITKTEFGWIEVDGIRYETDIIIYPDGRIENRYKNFSGNNHLIEKWEVTKVLSTDSKTKPEVFVVGTGQMGIVKISDEVKIYLKAQGIKLIAEPTPQALVSFNNAQGVKCGIFHVTC